jgi:hypothetical protein
VLFVSQIFFDRCSTLQWAQQDTDGAWPAVRQSLLSEEYFHKLLCSNSAISRMSLVLLSPFIDDQKPFQSDRGVQSFHEQGFRTIGSGGSRLCR